MIELWNANENDGVHTGGAITLKYYQIIAKGLSISLSYNELAALRDMLIKWVSVPAFKDGALVVNDIFKTLSLQIRRGHLLEYVDKIDINR